MAVSTLLPSVSLLQAAGLIMDSHQNGISRFIPAWKELCLKQEPRSEEGITQIPRCSRDNQARGRGGTLPPSLHSSSLTAQTAYSNSIFSDTFHCLIQAEPTAAPSSSQCPRNHSEPTAQCRALKQEAGCATSQWHPHLHRNTRQAQMHTSRTYMPVSLWLRPEILPCLILQLRSGCSLSLRQKQDFVSLYPAIFCKTRE